MSIKIKELPEAERPYEKLELYGEKALSNAELLAIIIKSGTKEETSVQLAQRLLKLNDTEGEDLNYLQSLTKRDRIIEENVWQMHLRKDYVFLPKEVCFKK